MHPILADRSRLWLYLAAWLPGSGLLAILLAASAGIPWPRAMALAVPLSLVYAFVCLGSWYPCQVASARRDNAFRVLATHGLAALVSAAIWIFLGSVWSRALDRIPALAGIHEDFRDQTTVFFVIGVLLYSLAVAVHYLLIAFEESQKTESHNLELQIQAREAKLRALQAQQDQALAERELELARSIQRRLMPPAESEGEGYRLAARHRPAHFVAGDFYDFFQLADDQLGLVVADVAGKGVGASLIMASVKAILPLIAAQQSVVDTLRALNSRLVGELAAREFVALAFARFDPHTGTVEVANSGLPDPYWLRRDVGAEAVEVPGPRLPLGMRTGIAYRSIEIRLDPGDRLLLLTDGLPEAPTSNGEPLGYEPLEALIGNGRSAPPGEWLDGLLSEVAAVTSSEPQDDLTALLLERGEVTGRRVVGSWGRGAGKGPLARRP